MIIKILGTGCKKCKKLFEEAKKAIELANVEASIVKVEKVDEIVAYGVMQTPALVIDEKIVVSGRVMKAKEMVKYLNSISQ